MNKFFIGCFSVLTVLAGILTDQTSLVTKGDDVNKMVHTRVKAEVAQLAAAAIAAAAAARASSSSSIRNGSTHSSRSSSSSYSSSSYSGGK